MKLSVVYDGPSRPILASDDRPSRLFSVSELIDGRWQSFGDEDALCDFIAACTRGEKLVCEKHRQYNLIAEGDTCPICESAKPRAAAAGDR